MVWYLHQIWPKVPAILTHEPALVNRTGVGTVCTDGSGRHSSDPQHRRCGVGYYTDTQERVWLLLPGFKQSVHSAESLVVVRALEECQPHEVVSDCKKWSKPPKPCKLSAEDPKVATGT
eukprot:5786107-Amphidinium_carterae.3